MKALSQSALAVAVLALAPTLRAAPTESADETAQFPYVIPVAVGASAFAPGDAITITGLRSDRPHLEPAGNYLVQGTYTLASVGGASIAFYCTANGTARPAPFDAAEVTSVVRGSGSFSLQHRSPGDGWLHLSFVVAGERGSHGGVYFGEEGVEKTILRHADWLLGDASPAAPAPPAPGADAAADPNRALMAYLVNPVPPPRRLDAKYTPASLKAAFAALSEKAGWHVKLVTVDDSEFPFLVYGVLAGSADFRELEAALRALPGYDYGGSVSGTKGRGVVYFAVNMIPQNVYPRDQVEACNRRLVVRLQMLANAALRAD